MARIHQLPVSQLLESPTNPRTHYDEKALRELAANIKEVGVIQPVIVRKAAPETDPPTYELVAGHRRVRAARLAELLTVPAIVRELTDDAVRLLQLVENGQREDLAPLDEARAYAEFLAVEGRTIRHASRLLGRDPSTIARRLTLISLAGPVQAALEKGALPVGHAELLGRIPDAGLQEQALARILTVHRFGGAAKPVYDVVPYVIAKKRIEAEFTAIIATAPFDPADPTLSSLGACAGCAYRTGNARDLFADIRGKDVCTNLVDFRAKVDAYLWRLRDSGTTVLLTPEEVRTAFPYGTSHVGEAFVDLTSPCPNDPKQRTYDQLLAAAQKDRIVVAYVDGRLRRLYPKQLLASALRASGHTLAETKRAPDPARRAERVRQRIDRTVRERTGAAFAEGIASAKIPAADFLDLFARIVVEERSWQLDDVLPRHGYEGTRGELQKDRIRIARTLLAAMSDAQKRAFILDCLIAPWTGPHGNAAKQALVRESYALAGVDARKIERRVRADLTPKDAASVAA
jgi:ParB/RepB/Spo0J family partition protein